MINFPQPDLRSCYIKDKVDPYLKLYAALFAILISKWKHFYAIMTVPVSHAIDLIKHIRKILYCLSVSITVCNLLPRYIIVRMLLFQGLSFMT